ncbi:uncharacterized protein LOC126810706 [Patella vulgata]|uniref:uncharacterized protein LOC126810706 n=1 Tax=Patella vulgata TaxID=6465 RepID=UPI00218034DC|nr:uncharacterized protein LOC126810706 [Patella vulgata]
MELGKTLMKENNVNALSKAIHPRHGLVWSDGKAIYLGPLIISSDTLQNTTSNRLGEFDNVDSVCWSGDIDSTTCFMSVVHQNNVTVWKVSGSTPKLGFKQVRRINVKPIQQGVLWNPKCDVLCLFSKNQVSFYFNHLTKKGSYAFPPLVSGKITSGCWSNDGNKLLVCIGSSLLIYTWSDIENSLSDFTPSAWTLPKSDGNVTAIVPISQDKYVCCVDLPLERLCQNQDVFLMPELPANLSRHDSKEKRREDLIKATKSSSIKENLLNLPKNPEAVINDSSQLVYFQINDDARSSVRLNTISLQGLVSPDLLAHEPSGCIIVGSNSQNCLQIFTLTDLNLIKSSEIVLQKSQRPKGICCPYNSLRESQNGVLVLVGQPTKKDALFPSATTECQFDLTIYYYPVKPEKTLQHFQSHSGIPEVKNIRASSDLRAKSISESALQNVKLTNDATNSQEHIKIRFNNTDSNQSSKILVSSLDDSTDSNSILETQKTHFKDITPKFHNEDLEIINHQSEKKKSRTRNVKVKGEKQFDEENGTEYISKKTQIVHFGKESETEQSCKNKDQCKNNINGTSETDRIATDEISTEYETEKTFQNNANRAVNVKNEDDYTSSVQTHSANLTVLEDSLSDHGLPSSSLSMCSDDNYEFLEKVVEGQKDQIEELQKKVKKLSKLVDQSSVIEMTKYQTPEKPDSVKITCLYESGTSLTRKFLLDNGRLQLAEIKRAFKLDYIALLIDEEPIVLGANIDGYIPLKFTPGVTLNIIGENKTSDIVSANEDVCSLLQKDPITGATKC